MQKKDYTYTHRNEYKIHIVSLTPRVSRRILLIPPLVGARGILGIRTFRYFLRSGCILMSFDYCGHYDGLNTKFTLGNTFRDTEVALHHAIEYSKEMKLPLHVVGSCYGLIPLLYALNNLEWPPEVKSLFSVSGLLRIDDLLKFDGYKPHLAKRGIQFENKSDFIHFMSSHKTDFINTRKKYIDALTDYFLEAFQELQDVISSERFGVLRYSNADFHKTFYEFMTLELPEIRIPEHFPCLFFLGDRDTVFGFQTESRVEDFLGTVGRIAPHAKILNIRIDHFGRGEDHYVIGREGVKFLIKND